MSNTSKIAAPRPRRSAQYAAQLVTAEIARFLEQGHMPWRMPWDAARAHAMTPGLPLRATGQAYRGANIVLLWAAQLARGYAKRTWLTYKQAEALGGLVRKGEKACPIIYYGQAKSKTDASAPAAGEAEEQRYRFLKLYHVFNVQQIDALPEGFGAEITPAMPQEPSALQLWCERAGARVRVGGASAHYAPSTDAIHTTLHRPDFRAEPAHNACAASTMTAHAFPSPRVRPACAAGEAITSN